jgi:hypothetical protein
MVEHNGILPIRAAAPIDPDVRRLMLEAEETEFPPVCLAPVADFLLCSNCQQQIGRAKET